MSKKLMSDFCFGFELEGTYEYSCISSESLKQIFDESLGGAGNMHGDGSLRANYGYSTFEYSSPVIKYSPHNVDNVVKFLDNLPSNNVVVNNTCGFHTHISFKGITKFDAIWAMVCMVADGSFEIFQKLGRTNLFRAPYAKNQFLYQAREMYEAGLYDQMIAILMNNEKYRSIRIHPQGTIEWRGPRTFLNRISHKKNVAYMKKLSSFMSRINDSLNEVSAGVLTKEYVTNVFNKLSNRVDFKETNIYSNSQLIVEKLEKNPSAINNYTEKTFENINNKGFMAQIYNIIRNSKTKITSDIAFKEFARYTNIQEFVHLVDVNVFKRNLAWIGEMNALTPTFSYLLRTNSTNPILKLLVQEALNHFGKSSIKTFTYNAMIEMIKYNRKAFKIAINTNLAQVFGEERALRLIDSFVNNYKYDFLNSSDYKELMESENQRITSIVVNNCNFMTNTTLNDELIEYIDRI